METAKILELYREFEESVWNIAVACEKHDPAAIDKAEAANVEVGRRLLASMLGREPTDRELSLATMY